MKPKIFIGSSVEGLPVAKAIQLNLEYYAYTEIWSQIDFKLSSTTLDTLIEQANKSDFAIFVFSPDDALTIRKNNVTAIRDNVLFELGLFMGAISRNKVYFIKPRGVDLHIPTDLWGITAGEYDPNHDNLTASVGPFCTKVETLIKELYVFQFPESSRWGLNLLAETTKKIEVGKKYCLCALIPKNAKLELQFTYTQPPAIGFSTSQVRGFNILDRDAVGIKAVDLEEPLGDYYVTLNPDYDLTIEAFTNGNSLFKKHFSSII